MRCLRSRKDETTVNDGSPGTDRIADDAEMFDISSSQVSRDQEDDQSSSTPKQRPNIFRMFGIVSPFLMQKVPTEEELRRFSLAVHLWAEKVHGGVIFLQQTQLTERHFNEIMVFAGPSSRWKLIPDRSVTQYKNLWQNAVYGDTGTGFETETKLHDPSKLFCPFDHCKLNSEMIKSAIDKNNVESLNKIPLNKSRRELFAPDKRLDKLNSTVEW